MRYRLLGNTGLRVSEIFLGAMRFGGDGASREECARIIDHYADAGGNVIDTAVNYGDGDSERAIGAVLGARRDRFVLSTKYTISRDRGDLNAGGNHRKNLVRSLETSLRQLGADHIDLYWVHVWDSATPVEETMRALDDVVRAGKVLYIGISDTPAWVVSRANMLAELRGWTSFAGIQVPYNLLERDVERDLLPMAEALGLSVAAWSPLAHGALAADPDERTRAVVTELRAVAAELGATPAQVAIAWLLARSGAVHPITGAGTVEHLVDTLGALGVDLPAEAADRLTAAGRFTPGFPQDFIEGLPPWVFGDAHSSLVRR
ncbi:aldo/keto reductase [Actinokineospora sp. G85]|uniref:aldo/keto reductase n=1 Tax=Actinokineospora sp. G85 TaxID=3406626 RepID=UPI003C75BAC5